MAVTSSAQFMHTLPPEETAEERQLKNERKRIEGMIRDYQRNPKGYNPQMIASLERMGQQYGIPFGRVADQGSAVAKTGAFLGGIVDSVLLDFLPDKWYSSEATRSAKNWGKGVGTVGFIAATFGAGALAKGAATVGVKGAGALTAKQVARQAARTSVKKGKPATPFKNPPGNAAQRRKARRKHERDPKNRGTSDVEFSSLKDAPGKGGRAFDAVNPETITKTAEAIGKGSIAFGQAAGYTGPGALAKLAQSSIKKGLTKIGQTKGWKFAEKALEKDVIAAVKKNPGDIKTIIGDLKLTPAQVKNITKAITKEHGKTGKFASSLKAYVKGSGSSANASASEIKSFINAIGNKKNIDAVNIAKIGKAKGISAKKAKEIGELLKKNKIKNFDDAAEFLIQSMKTPQFNMADLYSKDMLIGAASAVGATRPLTGIGGSGGLTPSRREFEEEQYDPYNAQY